MAGLMWLGSGAVTPPAGHYASPTGTDASAGTFADPWSLKQAFLGGFPLGSVTAGDTVWLRGGTYTAPDSAGVGYLGHWNCELDGAAGSPIVFRAYPGERVILDGNYNAAETGNSDPTVALRWNNLTNHGSYVWLRDVEITNSNTELVHPAHWEPVCRGDGVYLTSSNCKLINCIIHDSGEGFFLAASHTGVEVYGNLVYYNGMYAPYTEQNSAVSVDLPDTGGVAPTLSGSYTNMTYPAPVSPNDLTISHNNAAGNYSLFVVAINDQTGHYQDITATCGGDAMTRIVGINGHELDDSYTGWGPVAMFGITGHTGTNSFVAHYAGPVGKALFGMVQSFANVGAGVAAGGTWAAWRYDPIGGTHTSATTVSDTNHLVVDGMAIYNVYYEPGHQDYAPNQDNTGNMIGPAISGNLPLVRMSWAAGAASVDMGWNWSPVINGHGHGAYIQGGNVITNGVTNAGNVTITSASNPWVAGDVGQFIEVEGTETGGHNLVTTIAAFNGAGSIDLTVAPGATMTGRQVMWGPGHSVKDNIFLSQVSYGIQTYGSSGTGFVDSEVSGNLFVHNPLALGGRSTFLMGGSAFEGNAVHLSNTNFGFEMLHLDDYQFRNNMIDADARAGYGSTVWDQLVVTGNTFTGTLTSFTAGDFPANSYYTPPNKPADQVIIRPNAYEANRANVYVFNWTSQANVSVDLSTAVTNGTAIYVMNAFNYFAAPVWSGTWNGTPISLPMNGLTVAAAVGTYYTEPAATGPTFNAFIVRAQSAEPWR